MNRNILTTVVTLFLLQNLQGQIINGLDTLYGNEWIRFDQSYFKIRVAEDGIYRLTGQAMNDAGIPFEQATGNQLQLFHNGEEVPLYVTTDGVFSPDDYLEFFGKKNTSELDRHLFKDPDAEMMNPLYSLITDTSAYFLTWSATANPLRYQSISNNLTNLPPKEPYYMARHVLNYFSAFSKKANSQGISSSDYGITEGYSNAFANVQTLAITAPNPYPGGPDGSLYLRYGSNIGTHQQFITLNDQPLLTDEFSDFQVRQHTFDIPNATLQSAMSLKFQGLASNTDRQRIANLILTYPAQWKANNQPSFSFEMPASPVVRYLEIENFNASGGSPVLYDLTNRTRLTATFENNVVKIALPPSATAARFILVNESSGVKIPELPTPVQFIDYKNLNAQFIILSNPRLYDDGNGNNYVQQYADYRSSSTGGGYSTVIVDVQQLYDQFGWGLNRHPLSIRNFGHFVKKEWADVQYFFVVGKGREYTAVRTGAQLSNAGNVSYYVPTFGVPGADNLLTAAKSSILPSIPIGRIAVQNAEEIIFYLDKIKLSESVVNFPQTKEAREWMKRVLHLGGGAVNDQAIIKEYLRQMETIIKTNKFGANVHSFFKTSSDPIQLSQSKEIINLINNGVSIITFFGHSGPNTFDFSLDSPENYENNGKFPLLFSLGCYSGQIHGSIPGVSERFVLEKNKGAIAFMSSTSLGYISALRSLCGEYYNQLGGEMYGKGIGEILKKAIEVVQPQNQGAFELIQQFTLHGDPAYVLNAASGPDYIVNAESVVFTPSKISIEQDSFNLSFSVQNIGFHEPDSIVVEIRRDLPGGINILSARDTIITPPFERLLSYRLPTLKGEAVGLNRFYIKVDAGDDVLELPAPAAEQNNDMVSDGALGIPVFFFSNEARPVFPKEFGIVGFDAVELRASTANTFAESRTYLMEIDTTESFNSPSKRSTAIVSAGGVIRWQPNMSFRDSVVYYWRISPDSTNAYGFNWRNSSFLFLKNQPPGGWNQSHFFQFKKDRFKNLELPDNRRWKFLDDVKDVTITTGTYPTVFQDIAINNNSSLYIPWDDPIRGGFMIAVLDSTSVDPWRNIPVGPGYLGLYESQGIPGWVNNIEYSVFPYTTRTELGRKRAMTLLDSIVPDNNYVVIITASETGYSYEPEEWAADSITNNNKNLFNLLEAQGAKLIRQSLTNGAAPYWFVYKKNNPSFPVQEGFADPNLITSRTFGLPGYWDNGSVETEKIGPARQWDRLFWKVSEEDPVNDHFFVDVIGIKDDGSETALIEKITARDTSLSSVSAQSYPYLRLRFFAEDSLSFTPPQLNFWRIAFDPVAELALNPAFQYSLLSDTLQEGNQLMLEIAAENIGSQAVDSVKVRFTFTDAENQQQNFLTTEPALAVDQRYLIKKSFPTKGLSGQQNLLIDLNPFDNPKEEFRFNNLAFTGFFVKKDERNPLLDVWFDGNRIKNGDIVSAKPHIRVELRDENPYLLLSDTSVLEVFLKYPEETDVRRVSFVDGQVVFTPADATSGKNKATLELSPIFSKDGIYELLVQAQDVSGNQSGEYDYRVAFEVITKSSISRLINYPNPFSNATRFLYTMTGSEQPADFKIQVMTVSGRIVREITKTEIGLLEFGTHFTDFVWDGTDEYGDRLANGVYLYRMLVKNGDGKEWDQYDNGAEKYFQSGFGKMVLLR